MYACVCVCARVWIHCDLFICLFVLPIFSMYTVIRLSCFILKHFAYSNTPTLWDPSQLKFSAQHHSARGKLLSILLCTVHFRPPAAIKNSTCFHLESAQLQSAARTSTVCGCKLLKTSLQMSVAVASSCVRY